MPVRVLFLAGMGRSGTTLLERVLSGVPGVIGLGELTHLWLRGLRQNELCGCGRAFSDCGFWTGIGAAAFDGWEHVDVDRVLELRQEIDRVKHVPAMVVQTGRGRRAAARQSYADNYLRIYEAVQQLTGAHLIVDSSKQASLPHVLAAGSNLDLRVVHCVRDARAVCYAWTKRVRRPEVEHGQMFMPRYRPRTMAMMWSSHNVAVELLRLQGTPIHRVRYEDFIADPRKVTRGVLRFADLPTDYLSHVESDRVRLSESHTAAGNPMRFDVGEVLLARDDSWRSAMQVSQRRLVTAMTAPLLRRYGYPFRVQHPDEAISEESEVSAT